MARNRSVSQQNIAEKLRLHRTTVTKILNNTPGSRVSQKTIEIVFATARKMGYDFSRLRNIHRRRFIRKPVKLEAEMTVYYLDGKVHDKGSTTVKNLSPEGALVTNMRLPKMTFPVQPFYIILKFVEGDLQGIEVKGQIVRFKTDGNIDIGVEFQEMSENDRQKLEQYVA